MKEYNPKEIEKKWQDKWESDGLYNAKEDKSLKKFYGLIEFPYPSGAGMHVGHILSNTAMDIICRKRRMEGFNVLYPIGWDAFGLPTENYAIKTGIKPAIVTKQNTDNFRRQLKMIGFSFDWSREINTTDPKYYKWTQWIFLQLYKKGLAYKDKMLINWCPSCKIGLANEEAIGGVCDRCGGATEKKEKEQWMLAITKYADRLDKDLDEVDYLEKIKTQQRNWIGKSGGYEVEFTIKDSDEKIIIFTTRLDTIFGATYLVIAPEHNFVQKLESGNLSSEKAGWRVENTQEILDYINKAKKKQEIDRTAVEKEKTGVRIEGVVAINPANGKEIPVFVADFVLGHYGTGAVMAVPAHDIRDYQFASKYNLDILEVVSGGDILKEPFTDKGKIINSGEFDGLDNAEAKEKIAQKIGAKKKTTYKLRDWVFSRQRYWGEPIPLINCDKCGVVPVSENELPVLLPDIENYKPTDTGESPLASITEWVVVKCPKCGGEAKRETDTMPNWAGSSWYFLRYADTDNNKEFASKDTLKYWTPVDWYNGGMEHTTLHLLYSRFWHKFLFDLGLVPTSEPYKKRTAHGMILAEGGEKMSKSKGNVLNPDDLVLRFGADTLRLYEMFMGPFDQAKSWNTDGMVGLRRFLEKVWRITEKVSSDIESSKDIRSLLHKTIKKVGEDIESMKFNTAISQMMIFVNELDKENQIGLNEFRILLIIVAPFAPHICEELWSFLGQSYSVHNQEWPQYKKEFVIDDYLSIVVQINGKTKGQISIENGTTQEGVERILFLDEGLRKWIVGKPKKIIYVPNRLINLVF